MLINTIVLIIGLTIGNYISYSQETITLYEMLHITSMQAVAGVLFYLMWKTDKILFKK